MSAAIWAVEMKKIPSCKSGPIYQNLILRVCPQISFLLFD